MRAACQSLIFKCRRLCNHILGIALQLCLLPVLWLTRLFQSGGSSNSILHVLSTKKWEDGSVLNGFLQSYLGVTVAPLIFRNHEWASLLWGIVKSTVKAAVDDALAWRPLSIRWNVSPALFLTTRWSIILSLWKVIIP